MTGEKFFALGRDATSGCARTHRREERRPSRVGGEQRRRKKFFDGRRRTSRFFAKLGAQKTQPIIVRSRWAHARRSRALRHHCRGRRPSRRRNDPPCDAPYRRGPVLAPIATFGRRPSSTIRAATPFWWRPASAAPRVWREYLCTVLTQTVPMLVLLATRPTSRVLRLLLPRHRLRTGRALEPGFRKFRGQSSMPCLGLRTCGGCRRHHRHRPHHRHRHYHRRCRRCSNPMSRPRPRCAANVVSWRTTTTTRSPSGRSATMKRVTGSTCCPRVACMRLRSTRSASSCISRRATSLRASAMRCIST